MQRGAGAILEGDDKPEEGDGKSKKGQKVLRVLSRMWSAHQSFFGQMLMAAKVDQTVRLAQESIDQGKCVVIGIQNTGEAGLKDDAGENGCSAAKHCIESLLQNYGVKLIGQEKVDELLQRLEQLQLPMNPLDDLIDRLGGPRRVAEMTGRSTRQVCERGEWVLEKRIGSKDSEDTINIQERKKFMSGKKLVAIISDAASTGISLQADRRVQNDRRRVHITLQLPWSADKAVQQMGRSHRSNQSSAPEFKLLMTPIGGEWRFASAVAERLQQLGAITQGDRRATNGAGMTAYAVDSTYGMEAVDEFRQSMKLKRPWRGVDVQFLDSEAPSEMDKQEMDKQSDEKFKAFALEAVEAFSNAGLPLGEDKKIQINKFLNRLLGLKLKLQTQVFAYWHLIMEELIRDAKKVGKFQDGILDIGSDLTMEREDILFDDPQLGAKTCLNKLLGDRGVSWKKAKSLKKDQLDSCAGFYRSRKNRNDVYNIFLALEKKQMVKNKSQMAFHTVEPFSGFRPDELSRSQLRKDYERLDDEEAESKWKHVYELSKDKCSCKVCDDPANCDLKKRTRAYHILTGSVLPFWKTIKSYMRSQEQEQDLDEEDQFTIKVVRVETKDHRCLVGILIPNENAHKIKERILQDAKNLVQTGKAPTSVPHHLDQPTTQAEQVAATKFVPEDFSEQVHSDLTEKDRPEMLLPIVHGRMQSTVEGVNVAISTQEAHISSREGTFSLAGVEPGQSENQSPMEIEVSRELRPRIENQSGGLSCEELSNQLDPDASVSLVVVQDPGDETEDDSDVEPISLPDRLSFDLADDTERSAPLSLSSCQKTADESTKSCTNSVEELKESMHGRDVEVEMPPTGNADNSKRSCRDSVLSSSDTPSKFDDEQTSAMLHEDCCKVGDELDPATAVTHATDAAGESCFQAVVQEKILDDEYGVHDDQVAKETHQSKKRGLNARLPVPEPEDSEDDQVHADERLIRDAESKVKLQQLSQRNVDEKSKEKTSQLMASGLWEMDADADDFFEKGLKILQEAKRKDECVRRRYIPSQSKCKDKLKRSAHSGDKSTTVSRSGRLRKKTDHFASGKMKGQMYVNDTGGTESDKVGDCTETESDEDDTGTAAEQNVKVKRRGHAGAREGETRPRRTRALKQRQEASAVMVDKALKNDADARKVRFHQTGKDKLKDMAHTFLGQLLGRPELCGTMSERAVKSAIRNWIPLITGVGESMRGSGMPSKCLQVPKQPLKRQIKTLHPSCSSGVLKSLSNSGIRRVEAILGLFCQAVVQQISGIALTRGTKVISDESLMDNESGLENIKDETLRKLLDFEPLPAPQPAHKSVSEPQVCTPEIGARTPDPKDVANTDESKEISGDVMLMGVADDRSSPEDETSHANLAAMAATISQCEVSPVASDNEGDKTESETDLDEEEHEGDAEVQVADGLTEEEDMDDAIDDDDGDEDLHDDFRNRSHYCNAKCKFHNKYNRDEFMLCCEGCDEWFHGRCIGLKEGTIADQQVWVCSENCFQDLPLSQSTRDVVVGAPKRKYAKRESKERSPKSGDQNKVAKRKPGNNEAGIVGIPQSEDDEVEEVEWSEDYIPHFQKVSEAPTCIDSALVGCTVMLQRLSSPSGWFPAIIKRQIGKSKKGSGKFIVSYTRKATKGLLHGEHEMVLDLSEYGNKRKAGRWVLLTERDMPPAEPGHLYCKKSCLLGRENGNQHFMIFCEGCAVWFHGPCVGVEDGDVHDDSIWVCCQKCKYDLPRNLRSEALIGNSFKKQQEAGTACTAKILKSATQARVDAAENDSDDDIPILQRPAALKPKISADIVAAQEQFGTSNGGAGPAEGNGDESDDDEPVLAQSNSTSAVVMMKILEPLATFVGRAKMQKRDALTAVLMHIRTNNLFDPEDEEYVLMDKKLKPLVSNRSRVKLRKLAKRVAKYIVDEDGNEDAVKGGKCDARQPSLTDNQPPPHSSSDGGSSFSKNLKVLVSENEMSTVTTPALTSLPIVEVLDVVESPAVEKNLKKRLGFSEAGSPALAQQSAIGENKASDINLDPVAILSLQSVQGDPHVPGSAKRRRLEVDSENEEPAAMDLNARENVQAREVQGVESQSATAQPQPDAAIQDKRPERPDYKEITVECKTQLLDAASPKRKARYDIESFGECSEQSPCKKIHMWSDEVEKAEAALAAAELGIAGPRMLVESAACDVFESRHGALSSNASIAVETAAAAHGVAPILCKGTSSPTLPQAQASASSQELKNEEEDDDDLDFDALESQAINKEAVTREATTANAQSSSSTQLQSGADQVVDSENFDDELDLTTEELADIERRAVLGL